MIRSNLFICFLDFAWVIRKLVTVFSCAFFILDISIMMFGDCLTAFFRRCSREFAFDDFGDLISNAIPFIVMSAE